MTSPLPKPRARIIKLGPISFLRGMGLGKGFGKSGLRDIN